MRDYKITKNFRLSEFMVSKNHPDLIPQLWNFLTPVMEREMYLLCQILQPVRDLFGIPIHISSGFRTSELNEREDGTERSNHLTASAVDVYTVDPTILSEIYHYLRLQIRKSIFGNFIGELIYNPAKGYLHIALTKYGQERKYYVKNE